MSTRKYLAELLGTFLFLTIGYASVAAFGAASVPGLLVVPFAFPLGLLAAIFAFGHISGGHFNPAVTVAMVLDKRTSTMDAAGYIVAQVIGAIGAAAVVLVVAGQAAVASGVTKPGGGVTDIGALILEIFLTAGFVVVILASTKRAPLLAPLAIPLTLVAIHFASAPLSRRLGQSGPLDRLRIGRWRSDGPVDLHRRADRRRRRRLGDVPCGRWRRRGRPRLRSGGVRSLQG